LRIIDHWEAGKNMNYRKWHCFLVLLFIGAPTISAGPATATRFNPSSEPQGARPIEFITAEELKARLENNEPITVLDVRASGDIATSENKIKGALHVKLRRLKYRLALPPLNSVARNSPVVLYCACPNDEAAIRGAEILLDSGFKRVYALKGGWLAWKRSRGQTESRPRG
jgi:rhodanese-related sulfurtransferase